MASNISKPIVSENQRRSNAGVVEVARRAGVSIATVSRVINRPEMVSASTRARVQEAMMEVDFHINPAASALKRGHFKSISLVFASLSQPWYTKLAASLRLNLNKKGYSAVFYDLEHDSSKLLDYLAEIPSQGSSGVVLATGDILNTQEIANALSKIRDRMPLVVIGQQIDRACWPTVQYNDFGGAVSATNHLLDTTEGGALAFLGTLEGSFLGRERLRGFEYALKQRESRVTSHIAPISGVHFKSGYNATLRLLSELPNVSGILAVNDEIAFGASRALMEARLKIPDDVSLFGFGDTNFLPYATPSLSSVAASADAVATIASGWVWSMIEGGQPDGLRVVDRSLVLRESTRPLGGPAL